MPHINELPLLDRPVVTTDNLIIEGTEGTRRIAATEFKGEPGTNGTDGNDGENGGKGDQGEQGLTGQTGSDTRARESTYFTTALLTINTVEIGTASIATTFELLQVVLTSPARFRLYDTAAARDADLNRPVNQNPVSGFGLIVEVNNPINNAQNLDPHALGSNMDTPPTENIYYSITNNGSTIAITVTLIFLRKES